MINGMALQAAHAAGPMTRTKIAEGAWPAWSSQLMLILSPG
jgi:hypothetical protein